MAYQRSYLMEKLFGNLPKVEHVYFTDDWIIKSQKTDEVKYHALSLKDAHRWCFSRGAWLVRKRGDEQYVS